MNASLTIRVDPSLKRHAAEVAAHYGFDLTSVTRAFWQQMVRTRSIPLSLSEEPNEESLWAIQETEEILASGKTHGFKNAEEMFEALGI